MANDDLSKLHYKTWEGISVVTMNRRETAGSVCRISQPCTFSNHSTTSSSSRFTSPMRLKEATRTFLAVSQPSEEPWFQRDLWKAPWVPRWANIRRYRVVVWTTLAIQVHPPLHRLWNVADAIRARGAILYQWFSMMNSDKVFASKNKWRGQKPLLDLISGF